MTYGTLGIDTIQSSTTGTPTQFNDGSGTQIGTLCRAWVQIYNVVTNGTIAASFNVSSVTYNAGGDYSIAFTNALADNKYVAVGSNSYSGGNGYNYMNMFCSASVNQAPTTTGFRVASSSNLNSNFMCIAVFR